ncbi:MAG TPA: SIS domain-containing protein [Ktedonobacterales bacterium]
MPSLLEDEIRSQPAVVARLLETQLPAIEALAATLPPFRYALIAARGSSDHAALYAKYALGALAGYPVALAAPSLSTLYGASPRQEGALVVGISQSGQSPDIVAVVEEGRRQGCPTLALTNDPGSPLAAAAGNVIDISAGPERSIAATKTYTGELVALAALAACWSGDARHARLDELRTLPSALDAALAAAFAAVPLDGEELRAMERVVVVGRGYNFATASEIALKLKELTYGMAAAYSAADFRHGPIATVEAGSQALLIMPSGRAYDDMLALAGELREREVELAVISDEAEALGLAHLPMPLGGAGTPEWLSPVTAVVAGQVLALRLAEAKGLAPDAPRGLRKVTRTV